MSTWFITGCSTRLGRALAAAVLERGGNAVATARDVLTVGDLASAYQDTALALPLDVTDAAQRAAAVRAAQERFGGIDVLVNNAGYGYRAPLGITVTAVEPGAFRTDFSGRSLAQSGTVIGDYAGTAGRRRKEHDTVHGTQNGDPVKAAQALITAVESAEPPALLLLGQDALDTYHQTAAAQLAEVGAWEKLSAATGFAT